MGPGPCGGSPPGRGPGLAHTTTNTTKAVADSATAFRLPSGEGTLREKRVPVFRGPVERFAGISSGTLLGMSELTSLKVPRHVRDRLAAAANARGITVRALLDDLSRKAEDTAAMEQVAKEMVRLSETDPLGWNEYLDEGRAWEERTGERIDA